MNKKSARPPVEDRAISFIAHPPRYEALTVRVADCPLRSENRTHWYRDGDGNVRCKCVNVELHLSL